MTPKLLKPLFLKIKEHRIVTKSKSKYFQKPISLNQIYIYIGITIYNYFPMNSTMQKELRRFQVVILALSPLNSSFGLKILALGQQT